MVDWIFFFFKYRVYMRFDIFLLIIVIFGLLEIGVENIICFWVNVFLRIDFLEVLYDDFLGFLWVGLFWVCIIVELIWGLWDREVWGLKIRVRVLGVLRGWELKGDRKWLMVFMVFSLKLM